MMKDIILLPSLLAHLGKLQSRFTDFLTTDGEKPWRQREEEFQPTSRSSRGNAREIQQVQVVQPRPSVDLRKNILVVYFCNG
jgi:Protein of unknown function (DUF1572)